MPPKKGPNQAGVTPSMPAQSDDVKYQSKYKELKVKLAEIEEDNTKLSLKVLKSKKAIQRLRIERAILYDRLQTSAQPTNPFTLHTVPHLAALPPSTLPPPPATSTSAPPQAQEEPYLHGMSEAKLAALKGGESWGDRPRVGVVGEGEGGSLAAAAGPAPVPEVAQAAPPTGAGGATEEDKMVIG